MDFRDLAYLGLNEKEAKIYLATLELGKAPVQKIAEKANINRATAYVIIEVLAKRGLMSSYTEGKKQYFCAEAPEKLSLLFREEAMAIQRKQEYLDKILPEIRSLKPANQDKPIVRYFEGKAGMKAIAEELFYIKQNEKEFVRMIFSHDLLRKMFSKIELDSMRKRRLNSGTKAKAIVNDKDKNLDTKEEILRVSEKDYDISCDIAIFGEKVRIVTQKGDPVGLIIDNKEIAHTIKILFDLAFKNLKK